MAGSWCMSASSARPWGFALPDKDTILLATLFQIIKFRNVLEPGQQINNVFDACYVPREIFVTGELDAHDIGQLADGRIVFVNTLYNCLATPSERHSFTPMWKPPFISKIVKEDRCHLNGLAMEDGVPRYVTAVSKSDTIDGWRDRRFDGGIVIDVQTGEIVDRRAVHAAFAAALSRQALDAELGHRRDRLDRARGLSAATPSSTCSRSAPASCAGSPSTANMPSSGCRSRAISASRGWRSTRSSPTTDSEPWCGVQVIDLDTRRLRALVPHRWAGGRTLRSRRGAWRGAADGARLRHQRDFGVDHPRPSRSGFAHSNEIPRRVPQTFLRRAPPG